jgi:chorismate lyase/3-hydroxybenzoate synthase
MTTACLRVDYMSADHILDQTAAWRRTVLGIVGFSKPPAIDLGQVPVAASMTPLLGMADNLCEVFRMVGDQSLELATGRLRSSESPRPGSVSYRYGGDILFGSVCISEDAIEGGSPAAALSQATMTAYGEIFEVLEQTGHRHLLRVWNYLPEINRETEGDERYRYFNAARQAAFRRSSRTTVGMVPAACALGSPAGSAISIYFLASRQPPTMIENPRQTSAYHYPPKFGAYSPTFSRASVLQQSPGTSLFVSGTASIVGHETLHGGDVSAQTRETLTNIDALLDEANRVVGSAHYSLEGLKFKVYVRRVSDLAAIESVLSAALASSTTIVYLQADVCREDLLVEIEATGDSRS